MEDGSGPGGQAKMTQRKTQAPFQNSVSQACLSHSWLCPAPDLALPMIFFNGKRKRRVFCCIKYFPIPRLFAPHKHPMRKEGTGYGPHVTDQEKKARTNW